MSPARGPWYIAASAVQDYQCLRGWCVTDDGPVFERAERELIAAAVAAVHRAPRVLESGALQYRMGRPYRYRLIV
ncbi:MAG TPA: hypothetical protein VN697_05940, partial [Tepidiformaceae bacterium]|nr:hypothetical protein [Tepidiformaceae bacterium]